MAFSTLDVLDYLETLVGGLASVQEVHVGIPATISERLFGVVAVAAPSLDDKALGLVEYAPRFYIGLGYRLSSAGSTRAAERALATALDEFLVALLADRTLGGTVDDLLLDFTFANNALYQSLTAQECRIFPISLQVSQKQLLAN